MNTESKLDAERGEQEKGFDTTVAREEKGMKDSAKGSWLWLSVIAVFAALTVSVPSSANAQSTITICVNSKGFVVGINTTCGSGATPVSWTGPQGPTGAVGPAGPTGAQGPVGDGGAAGPIGMEGDMGPSGAQGPQGPAGFANPVSGAGGIIGPTGPTGPAGVTGGTGPTGPQGYTGAAGVNTEDVVVITGGTLGRRIGTQADIQASAGESLTVAAGNGAQGQGHLKAETFVPIPANPTNPTEGVLQDFHFAITPSPGGFSGAYDFFVTDITSPFPGGPVLLCTITEGVTIPGNNGANISTCGSETSCTCENDEQSGPGTEVSVAPGDSVAIIVQQHDNSAPANKVDVKFSMNYIHDDQI